MSGYKTQPKNVSYKKTLSYCMSNIKINNNKNINIVEVSMIESFFYGFTYALVPPQQFKSRKKKHKKM